MVNNTRNLWSRKEMNDLLYLNAAAKVNVGNEKNTLTIEPESVMIQSPVEKITVGEIQQHVTKEDSKEKEMVDIPNIPMEELEASAADEQEAIADEAGGSTVFGVVGIGQAGGRLAESFYGLGYKKALAVNTAVNDLDGLDTIPEAQKVLMTASTAGGAGKDMALGEQAATKHQQEVYEKMQRVFGVVQRVLICAGAGGGTGGGGCLRMVEAAKKYLTYLGVDKAAEKVTVLLTLPTTGEAASPVVADNAHLIASRLGQMAAAGSIGSLLLFDNDKIKKLYPQLSVKKFWPTVNATVTGLFHTFNVLSGKVGDPTSFDPADYQRVLSGGGCMIMGFTPVKQYTEGADISKAIRSNLERGLLCDGFEMSTARAAACIATASDAILGGTPGLMTALETGFDTLASLTSATVFRGIYETSKEQLVIYTMVTGLAIPERRLAALKKFQDVNVAGSASTKLYQ